MERNTFLFDTNKCVACMACIAGCSIENGTLPELNWRTVNSHNVVHHPSLPVFHFSVACQHCQDAPCMKNCPALAYTRDETTGAIIHHAEACIGCQYCTWACPYDAPKINQSIGIIEKCDFCTERLQNDQKPACVEACPIGALGYDQKEIPDRILIPGFVDIAIRPAIELIPLRKNSEAPEIMDLDMSTSNIQYLTSNNQKPKSKVELAKEWPLLVFSLIIPGLVGWFGAHMVGGAPIKWYWVLGAGCLVMLVSLFHLGKKTRALRSILNIRRSWLSREIFSLVGFLGFAGLDLILDIPVLGYIGLSFALVCLISIDKLYYLVERREKLRIHSASTLLIGILIFGYLMLNVGSTMYNVRLQITDYRFLIIGIIILVKMSLYLYRKIVYLKHGQDWKPGLSLVRTGALIIPVVGLVMTGVMDWIVFSVLMFGEIIDRIEFYDEAEVPSPESALYDLFRKKYDEKKRN